MSKVFLTIIAISALVSMMVTLNSYPVWADSADSIHFIDSGVTIFSPVNRTYNYRSLTLNVNAPLKSITSNGNIASMNYSIDGIYNGSVPLTDITPSDAPPISTKVGYGAGNVNLPALSDGSHYLTIYLYGLNMQSHQPIFKTYIHTVYFSIDDPNSIFTPIPSPSSTPTPSQSPSSTPSISPSQSDSPTQQPTLNPTIGPSIDCPADLTGFYITASVIVLVIIIAISAVAYSRRRRKRN